MIRTTYVKVSILEAGPDTVASLDFEWWEAISLRDWRINGDVTPETCELRVEAYIKFVSATSQSEARRN